MTVNNGDVKRWAGSLCSPSICQTSFSETGFTLRAKVVGELRRCCARAVRTPAPPTLVHPILIVQRRSKQLTRSTVSAVLKEAPCVSGSDCIERLSHSLH